jgi:hypothetical protein
MQGIKKGGTGRIPSVMRAGLLELTSTFLKVRDVVAEDSLEKDGTLPAEKICPGFEWHGVARYWGIFWRRTRGSTGQRASRRTFDSAWLRIQGSTGRLARRSTLAAHWVRYLGTRSEKCEKGKYLGDVLGGESGKEEAMTQRRDSET